MSEKLKAVVSAGGTREFIDDIRFISNISTGRLGYSIARKLVEYDYDVTIICPPETPFVSGGPIEKANHIVLTDTEALEKTLRKLKPADLVFHAAAVADYRPVERVRGKISSGSDSLRIELEKTPKILAELRDIYGENTFVVGFKLLSGVRREELVRVALIQNEKNRLDLTIANDLRLLDEENHPVILVTSTGEQIDIIGRREVVAQQIVQFVNQKITK